MTAPFQVPIPDQTPPQILYRQPEPPPAPVNGSKLNLDTLEREGGEIPPFEFTLGGRDYRLIDPQDVDWQDLLLSMRDPVVFFTFVLPKEDQAEFFKAKLKNWKMNVLMTKYQEHFKLPSAGEAAGSPR